MVYKLQTNRVHRTYKGGSSIDEFCNSVDKREYMPEDWTASVTAAYDSNGNLEGIGKTLDGQLLTDIIGNDDYGLLVKLLNSDERLVIQAHPTVDFAKKYLNSEFGKTECWYFLDCEPDAYVLIGFKEGATREQWEDVFNKQDIERMTAMLHKVNVKKGDFIFVDGGVPHAIGPGCFMVELQEPSDLMVVSERFTPSGRQIPERRMDMGLPYELMMDVYDYTAMSYEDLKKRLFPEFKEIDKGIIEILGKDTTDKFRMLRLDCDGSFKCSEKYAVAICIDGEGYLCNESIKRGERLLLKNEQDIHFCGNKDFSVILCL